MPSFAGPNGRTTTVSTSGGLTDNGRLLQELERLKLEQAIAAAKSGKPAPVAAAGSTASGSGSQDLAAQLASRLQAQREAAASQAGLQTQRLQAGSQDLAAQLASRLQLQREGNSAQAGLQTQRLQAGSQDLAAQLANRLQAQREGSSQRQQEISLGSNLKQQEMSLGSKLDEDRKKEAAARALALFNTGRGKTSPLDMAAARAQLA